MRILLLIPFFIGCISSNKLAQICAERYPVKEETKEVIIIDTILTKGDTILVHFKDSVAVVICPPIETITKTKEVVKTIENTAKLEALKESNRKAVSMVVDNYTQENKELQRIIDSKNKEIVKLQNGYNRNKLYRKRFFILLSVIILYFASKFSIKKFLSYL
jgi:hypothetical protein